MSDLGIVAIGRNEGERLRRCLDSVVGRGLHRGLRRFGLDATAASSWRGRWGRRSSSSTSRSRSRRPGRATPASSGCNELDPRYRIRPVRRRRLRAGGRAGWTAPAQCSRRGPTSPWSSVGVASDIAIRRSTTAWPTSSGTSPIGEAKACGGDAMIRIAGLPPRRRLQPVDHRRRGRRALPADPRGRVEGPPHRRRDDPARHRHDPVRANGGGVPCAAGMPTPKARHATAAPPSATSSARCAARSSGGSACPARRSAWPGRLGARASPCWRATWSCSGGPNVTIDCAGAGPRRTPGSTPRPASLAKFPMWSASCKVLVAAHPRQAGPDHRIPRGQTAAAAAPQPRARPEHL